MTAGYEQRAAAIEAHYAHAWAPPDAVLRCTRGPVHGLPPDFAVLSIPRARGVRVYATRGMSVPEDEVGLELFVLARDGDRAAADTALLEILTAVAHYHRTGARLDLGHTVNFGQPWLPGSRCTHGLLSLPYLDGPSLEWMDKPRVRFVWLIPITPEELLYKKQHGLDALEGKFEAARFDYLDPHRPSVCP